MIFFNEHTYAFTSDPWTFWFLFYFFPQKAHKPGNNTKHKLVNLLWHLLNTTLLQSHWMGSTWCREHSLCAHIFWDNVGQACLSGRKQTSSNMKWAMELQDIFKEDPSQFQQETSLCLLCSKHPGCSLSVENGFLLALQGKSWGYQWKERKEVLVPS